MTQTTVARRIDALEHKLGIVLFNRDTRGFNPTADARTLLPAAEAVEVASMEFEKAAMVARTARSGPIRFTAADSAMNVEMAAVFADFSAANPRTRVEFLAGEKPLDLAAGEADVALRMVNQIADESLICRRVGEMAWTYYSSKAYAEAHGVPNALDEDFGDRAVVTLRHIPNKRMNLLYCDSSAEVLKLLRMGRGIGPMPVYVGDREQDLMRCFPPSPGTELGMWLLASPAAYRRAEVRRFMAFAAPRFVAYFKTQC